jgi:hypothetical protein
LIILDHNYESLTAVLDDDHRDALMTRLHTPEEHVELDENELLVQFQNNQKLLFPIELQDYMEYVIMGKIHKMIKLIVYLR